MIAWRAVVRWESGQPLFVKGRISFRQLFVQEQRARVHVRGQPNLSCGGGVQGPCVGSPDALE